MNRVYIDLLILMMFFSLSSYSQDFACDESVAVFQRDVDCSSSSCSNGNTVDQALYNVNNVISDNMSQAAFYVYSKDNGKDSVAIKYIQKYSLFNFPFFNFRVSSNKVYHQLSDFKSDQAKDFFILAKNDQFNSDSLSKVVNELYSQQGENIGIDENVLDRRVFALEQRASLLKKTAVQKAKHALLLEQSINPKVVDSYKEAKSQNAQKQSLNVDDSKSAGKNEFAGIPDGPPVSDSQTVFKSEVEDAGIVSGYEYRYQVAAFDKKPVKSPYNDSAFIIEEIVDGGKMYRYLTGSYPTYAKANSFKNRIKSVFPAAFIVVYKNGVRISLKEAIEITDQVESTHL